MAGSPAFSAVVVVPLLPARLPLIAAARLARDEAAPHVP
jgi:hypothetical protein